MKFPVPTKTIGTCTIPLMVNLKKNRYSSIRYHGELWLCHRLAFHLNCRKIPRSPCSGKGKWTSKLVLHECDNKNCIEPHHLYLGTHKDNAKDFSERFPDWLRKKKSETSTRIQSTQSFRKFMSQRTKGIKKSEEHKEKIRIASLLRAPVSEETRKKMSLSAKRRIRKMSKTQISKMMENCRSGVNK